MNRRTFLASPALAAAAAPKPNVVFILSDDHHYQALGAAGNPHIQTPNLDRLAARGTLFSQGTISTPQCCPSRGVLLSGLEIYQSGLRSNGAMSFRPDLGPTVVEQMRRASYETTLIGKWHIQEKPQERGFAKAPLWMPQGGQTYVNPQLRRGFDGGLQPVQGHITDLLTQAAIESIGSAKSPYLLWLAYNAPHTPWTALDRYKQMYAGKTDLAAPRHPEGGRPFDWATYYAVISHLDEAVGRVVQAVEKSGQWNNTLIVFLGDNGYLCGTKGLQGKVRPWEESVRVPFIASGGVVKARGKSEAMAASVDLPATFLDLAGIRPAGFLAGRSLRAALNGGRGPEESFAVWDDGRPEALAVREAVEPYRLVRTARHKLIVWESRKQALFDHVADPGEEKDLSTDPAAAAVVRDLRGRLRKRMEATRDQALAWL